MKTFNSFKNALGYTERRQIALIYHCRLAAETIHPRFAWIEGGHSVILTVNSGYE